MSKKWVDIFESNLFNTIQIKHCNYASGTTKRLFNFVTTAIDALVSLVHVSLNTLLEEGDVTYSSSKCFAMVTTISWITDFERSSSTAISQSLRRHLEAKLQHTQCCLQLWHQEKFGSQLIVSQRSWVTNVTFLEQGVYTHEQESGEKFICWTRYFQRNWGLFFYIVFYIVLLEFHRLFSLMLLCLDPIGQKSQQQISCHHIIFSVYVVTYIQLVQLHCNRFSEFVDFCIFYIFCLIRQ